MKLNTLLRTSLALFCLSLLLTACEKTDEDPVTADRDKYLGSWRGVSTGNGGTINFNMSVTASNSSPSQIIMENFDGYGSGVYVIAGISGNSIIIPQNLIGSDTIIGSGSYQSDNTLSFAFTVKDGQTTDSRTATARR